MHIVSYGLAFNLSLAFTHNQNTLDRMTIKPFFNFEADRRRRLLCVFRALPSYLIFVMLYENVFP